MVKYKLLNWSSIHDCVNNIASSVKSDNFVPDYVIAIARGGVVPARLVCDELHLKNFISIKASHWGITASKDGKAVLNHGTTVDLKGKKLLLVDDITDTGESMRICKEYLEGLNPRVVKTAALYHLKGSKFTPDYYGFKHDWAWMIWPWNYKEDMVNLTKKLIEKGLSEPGELVEKFMEEYKIQIGLTDVKNVLSHIDYLNNR